MENRDELDELFYQALRGKTVTAEMARAIEWVEGRVKHLIRAKYMSRSKVEAAIANQTDGIGYLVGDAETLRRELNLEGAQDAKHN